MSLPVNQVVLGDCVEVMRGWPADSIDLVVTSPPYWGLRDYGIGEDQLGLEPHPQLFIDHLVEICREIKRVLKPTGTFWLNLGDTYFGSSSGSHDYRDKTGLGGDVSRYQKAAPQSGGKKSNWLQPKQKLMIPARIAIALQHDGWILRNDIIWHKPNHMPGSWKDRLTCSYEHVFLFAKNRQYYFDLDAIRKPHAESSLNRIALGKVENRPPQSEESIKGKGYKLGYKNLKLEPKGKNPGDLWEVEEEKLTKHDIAVGRIGNFSYTDPLHTKEYHPRGKNPGDLWEIPLSPKYEKGEGHSNRQGMQRELSFHEKRIHEVVQIPIAKYLKKHVKGYEKTLDDTFGEHRWPHWIRTDLSGASLPGPQEWLALKEILGFDDSFDDMMTETIIVDNQIRFSNKGKNPGDLWRIPTTPFPGAHFATFPPKLIEPIVKAGSPRWICSRCGKPRTRITEKSGRIQRHWAPGTQNKIEQAQGKHGKTSTIETGYQFIYDTVGWSDCGCGEGWEPSVVMDPFGGSGTVGKVARRLGRRFILIDIIPEYTEMSEQRVRGKYKPIPKGVIPLTQFMEDEK